MRLLLLLLLSISCCIINAKENNDAVKEFPKEELPKEKLSKEKLPKVELKLKPAYFHPRDSLIKDIYGKGFIALGELALLVHKNTYVWIEPGYFHRHGKVGINGAGYVNSKITLVPISIGVAYGWEVISRGFIFFKAGPNYVYLKTKNDSNPGFASSQTRHFFGGTTGIFARYKPAIAHLFIEAFFNYRYDRKEVSDNVNGSRFHVYAGGTELGGSIGFIF